MRNADDHAAADRRSFTRLFCRETRTTLPERRQQACLAVALPQLQAGEAVTTIALDLGYESSTVGSTRIKRVVGPSPSRHR